MRTDFPLVQFLVIFLSVIARQTEIQGKAGDNISRATISILIGNSGLSVVPDTRFRQPISALEFIPNSVPVIFESKCTSDIFPVLATGNNPNGANVRPGCDNTSE